MQLWCWTTAPRPGAGLNALICLRLPLSNWMNTARRFRFQNSNSMIVTEQPQGQENVQTCANVPRVVVYTTSTPLTLLTKSSIRRLFQLLDVLGIAYTVVDLAETPSRKRQMLEASNGDNTLPQLHVEGKMVGDIIKVEEMHDFGVCYPCG